MRERVLGANYNKGYENVASMRGYARYLTHADNPEKAQYDRADVVTLGGADYDEVIHSAADDSAALREMYAWIKENNVKYYHELVDYALAERSDWARVLHKGHIYAVSTYIRSIAAHDKDWRERAKNERIPTKLRINEETGEITESFEEGDQSDEDQD